MCYNKEVRQEKGYVNRTNKEDKKIKNGCKSHQPQNWYRSERYGDVNTLDWKFAPFLTSTKISTKMPRSCKGKGKRAKAQEWKAIGTKSEPKLKKEGKREGTKAKAWEEGMPKKGGGVTVTNLHKVELT